MLTLFRRHVASCSHRSRQYRRCRCRISVEGTLAGQPIRKFLDLTSWEAAQDLVREWEAKRKVGAAVQPDVRIAGEKFIADARARALRESTLVLLQLCESTY